MLRKIIQIDEDKCNGCGACATACHEGAIGMVNGKATLLRDDYCDGLGNCLPVCPTGAIAFVEREAAAFNEQAVLESQANAQAAVQERAPDSLACGCPGTHSRTITRSDDSVSVPETHWQAQSRLSQWPVQIKLAPVIAPYFHNAKLLVAADCTAFAYGNFHERFIKNHVTLIGCPKLDMAEYSEKLSEILRLNDVQSVSVVRMEVPCCGGIEHAVKTALQASGKMIPWQVVTITTDGRILNEPA